MALSVDFQSLPAVDKYLWLKSSAGIVQLQQWLSEGYSLHKVASQLCVHNTILYRWCRQCPELAEITGRPLVDLSRPPSYRLVADISSHNRRGQVLAEYATAPQLWQDPFFDRYFTTFRVDKQDYYDDYLKNLTIRGFYQLTYLFTVCYCEVTKKGTIKILKPTI